MPEADYTYARQGKQVIAFKGLVALAHERWGDKGFDLRVAIEQLPNEMNGNVCVCFASVVCPLGGFQDIGDASPDNVGRNIAPHFIRMASTRAMARVLRIALNVGAVAAEELVEELEHTPTPEPTPSVPAEAPVRVTGSPQGDIQSQWTSGGAAGRQRPSSEGLATVAEAMGKEPFPDSKAMEAQVKILVNLIKKQSSMLDREERDHWRDFQRERVGKKISDLTYGEANKWIETLVRENDEMEEEDA